MIRALLPILFLAAAPARAELVGYVVKLDGDKIYLDLGQEAGAAAGQEFTVFVEGEELKHPVTHESLGRLETKVAQGRIEEIAPKYSVGRLALIGDAVGQAQKPAPGQRVRLAAPSPMPQPPAVSFQPPAGGYTAADGAAKASRWHSPGLDLEAVDLAVGDVDGDGRQDFVLADQTRLLAYPDQEQGPWKPACAYENHDTGFRFVSVDAADLDGNGRAEVFATYHNGFFDRVETMVFECKEGAFQKTAVLPHMSRAYQDGAGKWRIAAQQLIADKSFPLGSIADLEFKDGKYAQGAPVRLRRVDFAYGFAVAQPAEGGEPFPLYLTSGDRIRAQFKKKSWSSPESFGQTAIRIRWHENLVKFRPRFVTTQEGGGFGGLYAVRNIAKLAGLADAFGSYDRGEVHFLKWNGISLEPGWKAELGGYISDIAWTAAPGGSPQLVAAVVAASGKTLLWKFVP